ncbi:MAG: lipopolysaccharide biosynthesis protein, partial [Luteimonas sp.]
MSELQGMGLDQAVAQLRRRMTSSMLLWAAFHLMVGLLGTWCARRYAVRRNLLDQPGARRSHDAPTPRGGGIAIVFALVLAAIWLGRAFPEWTLLLTCFAIGVVIVAGVGWIDDHRPLSAWVRLIAHLCAAALLAWGVQQAFGHPWLTAATLVLGVGLTNAWNFMDGIDGLAVAQATIIAVASAIALTGPERWLAVALAAACAGFLPMNFPKARIFLGDVGSGALGFAIAALLVFAVARPPAWEGLLVLLPLSA